MGYFRINKDLSFLVSSKDIFRGYILFFSVDYNIYLFIYKFKVNVEKYYWLIFDLMLIVMFYFKVLERVNVE